MNDLNKPADTPPQITVPGHDDNHEEKIEQSPGFNKYRRWLDYFVIVLGSGFIVLVLFAQLLWFTLPNVAEYKRKNPKQTAMMRYRQEQYLKKLKNSKSSHKSKKPRKYQAWIRLSRISPHLIKAVLVSEDDKFYQHNGFDWDGINVALEKNLNSKRIVSGGSSISQQLAKNLYLEPTRNPIRKLREALITIQLEKKLSKKRILELYLNVIEWGTGIYGIGAAAQVYYQKSASQLNLAEAIRLASVLPNPHRFSPTSNNSRRMKNKRNLIAKRMLRKRLISVNQYQQLLGQL